MPILKPKAVFNEKHNHAKAKTLIVLAYHGDTAKGLTMHELADKTGVNWQSLAVSLTKWHRWRYIGRKRRGLSVYHYHIMPRGWYLLQILAREYPEMLEYYLSEMNGNTANA